MGVPKPHGGADGTPETPKTSWGVPPHGSLPPCPVDLRVLRLAAGARYERGDPSPGRVGLRPKCVRFWKYYMLGEVMLGALLELGLHALRFLRPPKLLHLTAGTRKENQGRRPHTFREIQPANNTIPKRVRRRHTIPKRAANLHYA